MVAKASCSTIFHPAFMQLSVFVNYFLYQHGGFLLAPACFLDLPQVIQDRPGLSSGSWSTGASISVLMLLLTILLHFVLSIK